MRDGDVDIARASGRRAKSAASAAGRRQPPPTARPDGGAADGGAADGGAADAAADGGAADGGAADGGAAGGVWLPSGPRRSCAGPPTGVAFARRSPRRGAVAAATALREMADDGLAPDAASFGGAIAACEAAGRRPALRVFGAAAGGVGLGEARRGRRARPPRAARGGPPRRRRPRLARLGARPSPCHPRGYYCHGPRPAQRGRRAVLKPEVERAFARASTRRSTSSRCLATGARVSGRVAPRADRGGRRGCAAAGAAAAVAVPPAGPGRRGPGARQVAEKSSMSASAAPRRAAPTSSRACATMVVGETPT